MRIEYTQSGGFVGAVKRCAIDTAALEEADRRELESLVAASGFVQSAELLSASSRDRRHYEITIEEGAAVRRIVCDDACLPPAARPLVVFLAARARPEPIGGGGQS